MNLTRFESDGIELYINTVTGESFATAKGYSRMTGVEYDTIKRRCQRGGHTTAQILTGHGERWGTLISEEIICEWLPKDNPKMASKLMKLGVRSFLHTLAGFEVKSTAIECRQEMKTNEKLPLDDLKDLAWLLKTHGNTKIKQKTLIEILKFHHPTEPINVLMQWYKDILFDKSEIKLPEKEIPLNATHLAIELDLFHPLSGLPNPQAANRLLERLGYQYRDVGRWKPTKQGLQYLAKNMRMSYQLFWDKSILYTLRENPLRYQATEALFDYEIPFSF